ncbi:hypothetical protein EC968_000997 [Mortierella alpina]|nr:hypothetical protein EC968_000997 [Mortierella alpina]
MEQKQDVPEDATPSISNIESNLPSLRGQDASYTRFIEELHKVDQQLDGFYNEEKIVELKKHRQMILICDGYDETQLKINLHTANKLNQEGQPNTKMIISCRSTYLGQDYRNQFQPQQSDRYSGTAVSLYTEAVIVPFSSGQIQDYVDQFVRDPEVHKLIGESRVWSTKDYMSKLQSIQNMMDLARNPFLLSLSLSALPLVVKDATDL